ncbi:MAG: sulfurtransferase TusA family protein [Candidatus Delongbacteria bacterium]|nr:sulfurtransferase TusA family protein [Candidatus Delongbacteria bacterium]MBN2836217.1 sulfurtransferase TusA family protein [Candidatus Delongbacteria bacterium]
MNEIDVRGLSCPEPVMRVSKALKENLIPMKILLDSEASKENVARLLSRSNKSFEITNESDYTIYIVK